MVRIELGAARIAFAIVLLTAASIRASAQNGAQDGIDRNLLQREQRAAEFHVRLYDDARALQQNASVPLPPVPHSFVGRELYDAPAPTAPPAVTAQPPSADPGRRQLDDSQLRRQLELQTQNRFQDEPTRQQQSQIQQLQFGRENEAQQLQQQIRRDSDSTVQRVR